jgi:hypothetical protein
LVPFKNGRWHTLYAFGNWNTWAIDCFALEGSKVGSKNVLGRLDVHAPNQAVREELRVSNFGELAHSWEHNDVLDFLGEECITILTLGVFLLMVFDSIDKCPCTQLVLTCSGVGIQTLACGCKP